MRDDSTRGSSPVRIGLVGAGHWAATMHAPMHSAGAETCLTGIWTPSGRGADLAARHGVPLFGSYEELLAESEAVDFAVPPSGQAELGRLAARAGKALLLEKPLGLTMAEARGLVDECEASGVATLVVLTKRYHRHTQQFLEECRRLYEERPPVAVTARYMHGGLLNDGFLRQAQGTTWRDGSGVLFDLGPHLLDLMDLAAGPVEVIKAIRNDDAVLLQTRHRGGAVGSALVSSRVATTHVDTGVDVFGSSKTLRYSTRDMDHSEIWPEIRREFALAVRHGTPVTVDAQRALIVQTLVSAAAESLGTGTDIEVT